MNTIFTLLCCASLCLGQNSAVDKLESMVRSSNHKDLEAMLKALEGYKIKISGSTIEGKTDGCSTDGCIDDGGCSNDHCPDCSWSFVCNYKDNTEKTGEKKMETIDALEKIVQDDESLVAIVH